MTEAVSWLHRFFQQEQVNFLLTNRIPRRWATLLMGWFSRIEQPLVRALSLRVWQLFAGPIDLDEAARTDYRSLHDCFTRELKEGARTIDHDPAIVISPCDGIVGASGAISGQELLQAKGCTYTLTELLGDARLVDRYRYDIYVTLRLRSTMYHRFHAPCDCRVSEAVYISGDTWNVNAIALKRIERLFCKNERAVIDLHVDGSHHPLTLVPVAAILVASIELDFLSNTLDLAYAGPNRIA